MTAPPYEKLVAFYLGETYDFDASAVRDELLLDDSKDLTTHAVRFGMTGSGKTGLRGALLEEAGLETARFSNVNNRSLPCPWTAVHGTLVLGDALRFRFIRIAEERR